MTRGVVALGLLALALVVVWGRRGELSGTADSFAHIEPVWIVLAVAAEALSMMAFSLIAWRLLRETHTPLGIPPVLAITVAGNAITNSLPAGPAFGAAYSFRRYRERHVPDIVSAWVVVAVSVLAGAALTVLASIGVMSAVGESSALDLVGVTAGALIVAVLMMLVLRRPRVLGPLINGLARVSHRLIRWPRSDPDVVATAVRDRLEAVTPGWKGLAFALGWALANWFLDLAALVCAFGAVNAPVPWRGLLLAYGAAQLAANLPITPGGLGVVEGSLTIGLVAYGGAEASSVAAVLVYRVISFWAMLVIGWAVVGGLTLRSRRRDQELEERLEVAA